MNDLLSSIYFDPSNPNSLSSVKKLYSEAKTRDPKITLRIVKDWLSSQRTYTLHKPVRRRFKRNPIIVSKVNELWQVDLADMSRVSSANDGYKYLLTVIDVFSKYAFVRPLKTKRPTEVLTAFKDIVRERQPITVQSDKGSEFVNSMFKSFLNEVNINFYTSQNEEIKCSVIERFNRTLKSKIFKYLTANNTNRYLDVLQTTVAAYNNSYHRAIKLKPSEVNENNEDVQEHL